VHPHPTPRAPFFPLFFFIHFINSVPLLLLSFSFACRKCVHVWHYFLSRSQRLFVTCVFSNPYLQERFEHCVLPAEHGSSSSNRGARASIVFKSSMLTPSGRRGHGVAAVSVSTAPPPSSLRPTRGQKNPDGTAEEACSNRRAVAAGPPPSDEKRTKRRKPKVVSPPPTPQRPKRRGRP
jgi:hypothetical protein